MSRNQEFFHGTTHDIERVLPSSQTGISNWGHANSAVGQDATEWAHSSTNEHAAWMFAQDGYGTGRARVYRVQPEGRVKKGVETENDEYIAKSFKVRDQIDIKPGHQGTFPNLNWHQFSRRPPTNDGTYFTPADTDVNHPSDSEINEPDPKEPRAYAGPTHVRVADPQQMDLFTGKTHQETQDEAMPSWEGELRAASMRRVDAKMVKHPSLRK